MTIEEKMRQYGDERAAEERKEGIMKMVSALREVNAADDEILKIICLEYELSKEAGEKYLS